jgi:hypothetical protein
MDGSAIYELGSRVYCSDAECGELLQFVVEPEVPRLTDLVVCSVVAARLVAPGLAHPTRYGVLLDCDRAAYDRFPETSVRGADRPPEMLGIPETQTRIRRGDRVRALDGDAGRVLGLVVRAEDAAITHLLLSTGHFWHPKHAAVPVDYVAGLGFAGLDVLLTRDKVADFADIAGR